MNKRALILLSAMAAGMMTLISAYAADEPAKAGDQPSGHMKMDHSPADAKAMRNMPKSEKGAAADQDGKAMGMDHSPADAKAMRNMPKSKAAHHGKKKAKHKMMDHSPADAKAMRNMKDGAREVEVENGDKKGAGGTDNKK